MNHDNHSEKQKRLSLATDSVKSGDYESAVIELKALLDEEPDHELAMGMLASIYQQIGMYKKSTDLLEKLLNKNPLNHLAQFQLGTAQYNQGLLEQALASWEPVLKLDNEYMAHFHSALVLIQMGRNNQAQEYLQQAQQNMPANHPLYPKLFELTTEMQA